MQRIVYLVLLLSEELSELGFLGLKRFEYEL